MRSFRILVLSLACVVALSAGGVASAQDLTDPIDDTQDAIDDTGDVIDDTQDAVDDTRDEIEDTVDSGDSTDQWDSGLLSEETKSGVVRPVSPEVEHSILDNASEIDLSIMPGVDELPNTVVRLDTGSEAKYVLVNSDAGVSEATVTGYESLMDSQFLVATDVQISSNPTTAGAEAVFSNPSNYRGELVRVQIENYSQLPLAAHTAQGSIREQYAVGTDTDASLPTDPAELGLGAVGDTVGANVDGTDPSTYYDGGQTFLDAADSETTASVRRERYAGLGGATVDVAVFGSQPHYYVTNINWDAQRVNGLEAALNASAGDVVTVEASRAEARLSTRGAIEQVANCGDDWIAVPGVGCVPASTDVVAHAGVLYDDNATVPYFGASNVIQTSPLDYAAGDVEVTARVVNGSAVPGDVAADRALVAIDAEQAGSGSASEAAVEQRDEVLDSVRTSLYRQLRNTPEVDLPSNGSRPKLANVSAVPATVSVSENLTVNVTVANGGWAAYNGTVKISNGSATYSESSVNASVDATATASLTASFSSVGNATLLLDVHGLSETRLGTIEVVNESFGGETPENGTEEDESEQDSSESDDSSGGGFFIPSSGGSTDDSPGDEDQQDTTENDTSDAVEMPSSDASENDTDQSNQALHGDAGDDDSQSDEGDGISAGTEDDGSPGFGAIGAMISLIGLALVAARHQ